MPNTNDLYTTVKNVSANAVVFGFLGAHGKRLNPDETYTVTGDLVTKLGAQRSQRQFKALEKALNSGVLTIVKSPSVYLASPNNTTRELAMDNQRELGTTSPSWTVAGEGASPAFVEGDLNTDDQP